MARSESVGEKKEESVSLERETEMPSWIKMQFSTAATANSGRMVSFTVMAHTASTMLSRYKTQD